MLYNLSKISSDPKDIHTLAQLISAYSLVDPEKAKAYPFDCPRPLSSSALDLFLYLF